MISQADLLAMQVRLGGNRYGKTLTQGQLGTIRNEAELHEQIAAYCNGRGWLALHGRMDKPTGRTLGEPDFIIWAESPKVFLLECKRPGGKLSPVQQQTAAWLHRLGWESHVVTSFEEFLKIVHP